MQTPSFKYSDLKNFVLVAFLFLTACGGGSSGGGGSTQFAGTYSGTETLTITFQGQAETGSGALTITITPDGRVTVVDEAGTVHRGSLNGVNFNAMGGAQGLTDPSTPGVTCNINQTYVGSVNGNTITGTASGSITCTGATTITANFSGNFTATLGG